MNSLKGGPMSSQIARDDARQRDVVSIREKVAELERAQQTEDVVGFVGLLAPETVWVSGGGRRLTGRDEIHAFTQKVLPGTMKNSTARYKVVHVLFIRPDVAAVNVRQRPVTHDGEPLEGQPEGIPLYVMSKEGGEWKIAAAQNTTAVE
jgi:uncharacterized protein (TIGR02246 family)